MSGSFQRSFDGSSTRDTVMPMFHIAEVKDEAASAAQGRPIFREEERVQIMIPGGFNQPVFKVTDEHRQRWAPQYDAFKKGHEVATNGTPIDQWAALTRSQVAELKAINIFTVEQCAGLNDLVVQRIGLGGRMIKNAAVAYLDDAEAMALTTKLTKANEDQALEIDTLRRQVKELSDQMTTLFAQNMRRDLSQPSLDTLVPGSIDPAEIARQAAPQQIGGSSFDAFTAQPTRRRRRAEAEATEDI